MKKKTWIAKIKENCVAAGTYKPFFDDVIETLAGILEMRDSAQKEFENSKRGIAIEVSSRSGGTTMKKNPAYVMILELNTQALQYWRDLGLTPSGLKKINEDAMRGRKRNALADALKEFG